MYFKLFPFSIFFQIYKFSKSFSGKMQCHKNVHFLVSKTANLLQKKL